MWINWSTTPNLIICQVIEAFQQLERGAIKANLINAIKANLINEMLCDNMNDIKSIISQQNQNNSNITDYLNHNLNRNLNNFQLWLIKFTTETCPILGRTN